MRTLIALLAVILLSGCGEIPSRDLHVTQHPTTAVIDKEQRFKVESFGYFYAGHNNNEREVLIITDTDTKVNYLAITGCGATELIQCGKTKVEE